MAKNKPAPESEDTNALTEEETTLAETLYNLLGKVLGKSGEAAPAGEEAGDGDLDLGDGEEASEGPTEDDVRAALKAFIASRGATGKADAAKIIKKAGGVEKLADIPEDKRQAVIDLAKKNTK